MTTGKATHAVSHSQSSFTQKKIEFRGFRKNMNE
jgi:hypothetical protein